MNPLTPAVLDRAVAALKSGQIIAYPTETLYGLGVDPFQDEALAALLRLKGRHVSKGMILLLADTAQLVELALPPSPLALRLMAHFWPGPLTLLLPARPDLSHGITGGSGQIAVRISPAAEVKALLSAWGRPLVSTSANPSGAPPFRTAEELRRHWGEALAVILPATNPVAGHSLPPLPSTILLPRNDDALLLRAGALTVQTLRATLPDLVLRSRHGDLLP